VGNELELREAASRDRLSKSGRRTLQRPDTSQWIEQTQKLVGRDRFRLAFRTLNQAVLEQILG
jgi:hypothetical protein